MNDFLSTSLIAMTLAFVSSQILTISCRREDFVLANHLEELWRKNHQKLNVEHTKWHGQVLWDLLV